MFETTLVNPLNEHERVQLLRLAGHDMIGECESLNVEVDELTIESGNPSPGRIETLSHHLGYVTTALAYFRFDEIKIGSDSKIDYIFHNSVGILKTLEGMFPGKFPELKAGFRPIGEPGKLELDLLNTWPGFGNLETIQPILYITLYNLVKNAINFSKKRKAKLHIEKPGKLPKEVLYFQEGVKRYEIYAPIRVENIGPEFNRDEALKLLEQGDRRGFGLYFVGLAARFLQGAVDVKSTKVRKDSKSFNTSVTFYHPYYNPYYNPQK